MSETVLVCSCLRRRVPEAVHAATGVYPSAITIGATTFLLVHPDTKALLLHEAMHRRQQRRLGWMFYPLYAWEHWRRGYAGNRFEREAREAEAGR